MHRTHVPSNRSRMRVNTNQEVKGKRGRDKLNRMKERECVAILEEVRHDVEGCQSLGDIGDDSYRCETISGTLIWDSRETSEWSGT
jgi:hypothetical protein